MRRQSPRSIRSTDALSALPPPTLTSGSPTGGGPAEHRVEMLGSARTPHNSARGNVPQGQVASEQAARAHAPRHPAANRPAPFEAWSGYAPGRVQTRRTHPGGRPPVALENIIATGARVEHMRRELPEFVILVEPTLAVKSPARVAWQRDGGARLASHSE